MPNRPEDRISRQRLEDAVTRGIITAEQLQAIRALPEPHPVLGPGAASPPPGEGEETRRGLNAVTIAYAIGGVTVLFAFGWYIVDRWNALGPGGVLAVALVYAAVFALTARVVGRLGFHTASAVATLLAVGMTPLVAWSLLRLAGLWYVPGPARPAPLRTRVDILEQLRWIPLELATALAALVALRRVHFGILAVVPAAVLPMVVGHLMPLVLDPDIAGVMSPWATIVSAVVLLGCGYVAQQRTADGEDYAQWIYLAGLVTLAMGIGGAWSFAGHERHALPAIAVGLFALSLFLRRPMFLFFGAFGFIGYLAYLAFDVFRRTLSFPIVLATFGLVVITVTVWLQRRYPALARRVDERQGGRRVLPHAPLVFGGAAVVALATFFAELPAAKTRAAEARARRHDAAVLMLQRQNRARADSARQQAVPPR